MTGFRHAIATAILDVGPDADLGSAPAAVLEVAPPAREIVPPVAAAKVQPPPPQPPPKRESTPEAAEIHLDSKLVATTPVRNLRLTAGDRSITIKKAGYFDWVRDFQVLDDADVTLKATLQRNEPEATNRRSRQKRNWISKETISPTITSKPVNLK